MIWNLLIVFAVVVILIVVARKIPLARKKMNEHFNVTDQEMNLYGIIAQADDAFENRDFERAETLYVKAASYDPDNAKIYSRLGAIYLEQKNFYDARDAFLQAAKLEPDLASRYVNLALAYAGFKDYYKEIEALKKAISLDSKNKKYQQMLERAEKEYEKEKKRQK